MRPPLQKCFQGTKKVMQLAVTCYVFSICLCIVLLACVFLSCSVLSSQGHRTPVYHHAPQEALIIMMKPSCCLSPSARLNHSSGPFLFSCNNGNEETELVKILLAGLSLLIIRVNKLTMMIQNWLNRKLGEKMRQGESAEEREKESHAWRNKSNLKLLSVFKDTAASCAINEMSSGPSPDNRSVL